MCGIVGYIGTQNVVPILMQGLRRLEYRGYDSAGIAIIEHAKLTRERAVGRIDNLAEKIRNKKFEGTIGIAHTRWATHGGVTEPNAHPHESCDHKLALVHNGIIENYRELREQLRAKHRFTSETDSEVLAHLIEENYDGDLKKAVLETLGQVRGTYGLVVLHADQPDKLIVARLGSPIVIGLDSGEQFIASDPTPMLAYTKKMMFLDDGEIAEVTKDHVQTFNIKDEAIQKPVEIITWDDEQAQKQGYPHFMLKEIFDQPTVIQDAIRGRIDDENGTAHLGGLNMTEEEMRAVNRVVFIACGTAAYAGMVGQYVFEKLAGIPSQLEIASEFRYRNPILDERTLVFAVSQSGETADTLAAVREAKRKGAKVRGIVNVIGSTIARETDGGTYIHAGPELAVASTKAYTNMVAILTLYAVQFGRLRNLTFSEGQEIIQALKKIPAQMQQILMQSEHIQHMAQKYKQYKNMLFLGRGVNFPVVLEGALKMKEISYIHSEGYASGEMKHGVIALVSEHFPVLGIMTRNSLYEKVRSNIEEIRARNAKIILIANLGDAHAQELSPDVIYVPKTLEILEPLLNTLPLQLLAYHMAVELDRNVDRPRNLAKSVTVE